MITSVNKTTLEEATADQLRVLDQLEEIELHRADLTPGELQQVYVATHLAKSALHELRKLSPRHRPEVCLACHDAQSGGKVA